MKKRRSKKTKQTESRPQKNLVDHTNSKTRINRVGSELNKTQKICDLSHNKITEISQEKFQIHNIACVGLATKNTKTAPKKYVTSLLKQSKINQPQDTHYESGQLQSFVMNKIMNFFNWNC